MKKTLIVLAMVLAFALTASAQVPSKPFTIYAGGGLNLPNTPDNFKDHWKTGYHGMLGLGLKMGSIPGLEFVMKGQYQYFPSDVFNTIDIDGADLKMLMFGVDGRFRFSTPGAPMAPFALAGLGFANVKAGDLNDTTGLSNFVMPEDQTKFYFNIAAGLEFKAGTSMMLFVQAAYTSVALKGDAYAFVPITVGLKF